MEGGEEEFSLLPVRSADSGRSSSEAIKTSTFKQQENSCGGKYCEFYSKIY